MASQLVRVSAGILILSLTLGGCAKPPGELYLDTSIKDVISQGPGLYELHAPFDVPTRGPNFVFLRQGKDIIIASGDTLQEKIKKYMPSGDFSLIGRRMGQPKIWFAVDGIIVKGELAESVGHLAEWQFPSYEQFDPTLVGDYQTLDLAQYDFDKEKPIQKDVIGKKVRIMGTLRIEEVGPGIKRYVVESRNLKLELTPVGANLGYFLDLVSGMDTPFVAYGTLPALTPAAERTQTQLIGGFNVELLRYSQDILVRNVIGPAA